MRDGKVFAFGFGVKGKQERCWVYIDGEMKLAKVLLNKNTCTMRV